MLCIFTLGGDVMKRKVFSIIMVSALAFQIVACGSAEVANAEGAAFETVEAAEVEETAEEEEVAEAEAATQVEEAAETSKENAAQNFEGQYYAGKGNLSITGKGDGNYLIEVWWPSSAAEHSEWVMNAKYDEATGTLTYNDCVKHDYTLNENGEVDTDVTAYTDGTGSIVIVDGSTIKWNDDQDHIADDVEMTR